MADTKTLRAGLDAFWQAAMSGKGLTQDHVEAAIRAALAAQAQGEPVAVPARFRIGDMVRKIKGSAWEGWVVGTYSTTLTPEGYAVESIAHPGSVQIYPASALEAIENAPKPAAQPVAVPADDVPMSHLIRAALLINDRWPKNSDEFTKASEQVADMLNRRATLAAAPQPQPQQSDRWTGDDAIESPFNACMHKGYCLTLKGKQPQREPLTDEQILMMWATHANTAQAGTRRLAFARAIERSHGITKEGDQG